MNFSGFFPTDFCGEENQVHEREIKAALKLARDRSSHAELGVL